MKTVLIAEPHPPTRELLHQALGGSGYRVLETDDPGKALEICVAEHPDAVLMAVDLPRIQGAPLGKLLRGTEVGARIPILAVDKGHLGRAKGVGAVLDLMANGYLPDASRRSELLERLAQLIRGSEQAPHPTTGVAATLSRPPVVSGELKSRTLPTQTHSWFRLERTGILVLVNRDLTRRVFFVKGAPVNYDSSARQDSLPGWLLARAVLTSAQHGELLSMMSGSQLSPGAALVALGVVEAGEPLLALLKDYARSKIAEAYAMTAGRFSLYTGEEFTQEIPSLDIPALGTMFEAVRLAWPVKAFASALSQSMKQYPVRTAEFSKALPALGLTTADLKMALGVTGSQSLRDLLAGARDLKHALALFWYLSTVGVLRFETAPVQSAAAAVDLAERAARGAGRKKKQLPEAKAHELREDAIKILTASYFRALGLDITADGEAVERAYHEQATRFHPDSYAEFDLSAIEDLLASVEDKLSAAYRVLSEEEKRKAYVNYLLSRSDAARMAAPNVEAEIQLKRGEKLMKKGDLRGALTAFEAAVSVHAREPEYYSYLAWATYKAGDGTPEQRARAASKLLKKALSMNPTLERPQVIAAIIEDETGDPAEARRMLVKVLKAHPSSDFAKKALQGLSRRRGSGEKAS